MKTKGYIAASSCISPQSTDGTKGLGVAWNYHVTDQLEVLRPDYVKYIDPRQVRRMGKGVRMALCAGNLCIDAYGSVPDSIITATGLGSMGSTEKFLNQMIDNQEENLIPYAFLQTTSNTSGAQIALQHKIHGYNMTWVHKGISFELALIDALTLLESEESKTTLVGGFDEMTKDHAYIMHKAGLIGIGEVDMHKTYENAHPIAGEAASFFMITSENSGPQIKSVVAESGLLSPDTCVNKVREALEAGTRIVI
jgi:3-oxoacyl-[acyl-carrier-protein] synthase II